MSEFSLILVLQKENKQNSNMTWQKYKLNLRNSHLLEEFFQSWRNLTPKNNITSKIRERAISYVYDIDVYMKSLILFSQTPQPTPK